MTTRRNRTVPIVIGCVGVALGALLASQTIRHGRELAELKAAADHWRSKAEASELKVKALEEKLTGVNTAMTPASVAASPSDASRQNERQLAVQRIEAFEQRPEVIRLRAVMGQTRLDQRYSDLFAQLQLGPEDMAQLRFHLFELQENRREVNNLAGLRGINGPRTPEQLRELTEAANAETHRALAELLGPERYEMLQQYETTAPQRETLNQINLRLKYAAEPLTDAQSRSLVAAMRSNSATAEDPLRGQLNLAGLTEDVVSQAQAFLSAAQVSAMRQYLSEMDESRKLEVLRQEALSP